MYINNLERAISKLIQRRCVNLYTNCWLYTGRLDIDGYGLIDIERKAITVHRLSAVLFLGLDINNENLHSCHICSNKNCFNYDHLFIATASAHKRYDSAMSKYNKGLLTYKPSIPIMNNEESDYLVIH